MEEKQNKIIEDEINIENNDLLDDGIDKETANEKLEEGEG